MPKIIVSTGTPQDGEYELDLSKFSWRERAYITEISGTTPPEFLKKWFDVDPMTVIGTVAVMMQREGKIPNIETLMDADEGAITVDYSDLVGEDDASVPPAEASPPSDAASEDKNDENETSG